MRRWAFIIMIVGMFVLLLLLNSGPREVSSYSELEELEINEKVKLSGRVVGEKVIFEGRRVLVLEGGIELVCDCSRGFVGESGRKNGMPVKFNEAIVELVDKVSSGECEASREVVLSL